MKVEVRFTDSLIDRMTADIDVAMRLGWLEDSNDPTRRLSAARRQSRTVFPPIRHQGIWKDVPWVGKRLLKRPLDWMFEGDGEQVGITTKGGVMADTTSATPACVAAGAGFTVLPDFLAEAEIRSGRLVRSLGEWLLPQGGTHVVFPDVRFRPAKVRYFLEMLTQAEQERARLA